MTKLIGALRVHITSPIGRQDKVTAARHIVHLPSLLHHLIKSFLLNFLDALVISLLSINSIQDLLLGEDVQDRSDGLEDDGWVIVEEVREAPRLERTITPDYQIWTLINLGDGHCASALDIEIINAESKVMNHFILIFSLIQLWVDHLGFQKATEEDWLVGLLELLIVAKLRLTVITPHEQALLGGDGAGMDDACRDVSDIPFEQDRLGILEVTKAFLSDAEFALAASTPAIHSHPLRERQVMPRTTRNINHHMVEQTLHQSWISGYSVPYLLALLTVKVVLAPLIDSTFFGEA